MAHLLELDQCFSHNAEAMQFLSNLGQAGVDNLFSNLHTTELHFPDTVPLALAAWVVLFISNALAALENTPLHHPKSRIPYLGPRFS